MTDMQARQLSSGELRREQSVKAIIIRAALSLMVSVKIIQTAAQGQSIVGLDILM